MLNFCSLFSGSSGNSLFVQSSQTKILVDAGESAKKITLALESTGFSPSDLDAIIVTHEHVDHVKSIGTLSKKYNIPIYANKETWDAMPQQLAKIDSTNQRFYSSSEDFELGDMTIHPFSIPHDAANPCGFTISSQKNKLSIATDLGHITPELISNLSESEFILLESNYDPEIIKYSKYPYYLKQRISGEYGHLSNNDAGLLLSEILKKNKTKKIMLGHLSKENNFPELAYKTVLDELIANNCNIENIELSVAKRSEPSKFINLS